MIAYDKVDISKALLPPAVEDSVKGQIEFIRGNLYVFYNTLFLILIFIRSFVSFSLKQRLPFDFDTFGLIRMSYLTLCVSTDSWAHVYEKVSRVH